MKREGGAAEFFSEFCEFCLGARGGYLFAHVYAGQAVGAVDAFWIVQVQGEALVPEFGVGHLAVGVVGDVFSYLVFVVGDVELVELSVGLHDADLATVEVQRAVVVHRADEAGLDDSQGLDDVQVFGKYLGLCERP